MKHDYIVIESKPDDYVGTNIDVIIKVKSGDYNKKLAGLLKNRVNEIINEYIRVIKPQDNKATP